MLWDLSPTAAPEQPAEVWQERHGVWEKLGGLFPERPLPAVSQGTASRGFGLKPAVFLEGSWGLTRLIC